MKKIIGINYFLSFLSILILIIGCSEDDEYGGIFSLPLKNDKSVIFQPVDCEGTLCLNNSNILMGNTGDWHFIDLGEMNGIEEIDYLPYSFEWYSSLKIEPGKGYMAKNEGKYRYTFVKIYVESNIYDGNNILGVNIKYQSPSNNKVSSIEYWPKDKLVLNSDGDEKTISIPDGISFAVTSPPNNWIQFKLKWGIIHITATPNNSPDERNGLIRISSNGLENVYIDITQEGKK